MSIYYFINKYLNFAKCKSNKFLEEKKKKKKARKKSLQKNKPRETLYSESLMPIASAPCSVLLHHFVFLSRVFTPSFFAPEEIIMFSLSLSLFHTHCAVPLLPGTTGHTFVIFLPHIHTSHGMHSTMVLALVVWLSGVVLHSLQSLDRGVILTYCYSYYNVQSGKSNIDQQINKLFQSWPWKQRFSVK